jgi:hypothetical protein
MRRLFALVLAGALALASTAFAGEDYGVYVKAVEKARGGFDEVVTETEEALEGAGWKVLASYESGVEERCEKRAHNIVAASEDYAREVMKQGFHGAFAAVLRVGVYEDAEGISVAFTNPASINRTVLGDEAAVELSRRTMEELSEAIAAGVEGEAANEQIGQIRDEGYVGGMGGGKFMDKVKEIHFGGEFEDVVEGIEAGVSAGEKGWRLVYKYETPGYQAVVFGLTESATEAKAFDIAGERREKDDYVCPGIDHAAAFPIEVVAYKESAEASVRVVTLKEMYRMKLYFQDAGNWAFMKNMTMPGNIEDEVVEASTSKLK